jgi:hypothetical protein
VGGSDVEEEVLLVEVEEVEVEVVVGARVDEVVEDVEEEVLLVEDVVVVLVVVGGGSTTTDGTFTVWARHFDAGLGTVSSLALHAVFVLLAQSVTVETSRNPSMSSSTQAMSTASRFRTVGTPCEMSPQRSLARPSRSA